jgi:hypothetical protein
VVEAEVVLLSTQITVVEQEQVVSLNLIVNLLA